MKKKIKNTTIGLLISACLIILMFVILSLFGEKRFKQISEYQCETIGEIIDIVAVKSGFDSKVRFIINNDTIITFIPNTSTDVISEKFVIRYDCTNYKDYVLLTSKPKFLRNELIDSTSGFIKNIMIDGRILISYAYENNKFEKVIRPNRSNYKKGDLGKVFLWIDNPQRATFGLEYEEIIYVPNDTIK